MVWKMEYKELRAELLALLNGGNAHMTLEEAAAEFPSARINEIFPGGTYSSWHLLEHMRIGQSDILDFIRNENYKEMEWPRDYWPARNKTATKREWDETIARFNADSDELKKIVSDPRTDLNFRIPWGNGQTILREILLTADHTAYHLGEFAIMRQVMGTWGKSHK